MRLDFDFDQWTRFESLEDSEHALLIDPAQLRASYLERLEEFQQQLFEGCRKHSVDIASMVNSRPYDEALASYLALRGGGK